MLQQLLSNRQNRLTDRSSKYGILELQTCQAVS